MTLIADSGSTKTAWCVAEKGRVIHTQGINPFQQDEQTICDVLRKELMPQLHGIIGNEPLTTIHFYGAGCTPEKAPVVATCLKNTVSATAEIHVESDMLGAARSACGRDAGTVCILGTGSNSCYYDGKRLHPGIPALGYILGDEGSGACIGKRLVSDILKQQLPPDICQIFFDETHETQANIIQRIYRTPLPNRYLASLSPFCARYREHPAIHALLIDCFTQFFRRNIDPLKCKMSDIKRDGKQSNNTLAVKQIHFIGSIAHHYRNELTEAAEQCGYTIGHILQSPLERLVQYHLSVSR